MNQALGVGIVDFVRLPFGLNLHFLSPLQITILKAINGEPLTPEENVIFRKHSGKDRYDQKIVSNVNILTGRRSGKSTVIAPGLCLYYASQLDWTPYLRTSPWASFTIISASKKQANEIFDATAKMVRDSQYLCEEFLGNNPDNIKVNTIEFTNRCRIIVLPADHTLIRGFASPFVILDENCFYGMETDQIQNSDHAIEQAITPAMAQFGGKSRIIKISTPNGERGIMHRDYLNRQRPDVLFIQATSKEMNPTLSDEFLEKERLKGDTYFAREYLAQWTATESTFLDPTAIQDAVLSGITQCPPRQNVKYIATMDYATKGDRWCWCVGHREKGSDGTKQTVIDYMDYQQGSPSDELDPEEVIAEIAKDLSRYGCTSIFGDQNSHVALVGYFKRHGITLKEFNFSNTSKLEIYTGLQVALNSRRIKIVDHAEAIKDLKDLRERRTRGNRVQISHADNCHDDFSDSIALCHFQLDQHTGSLTYASGSEGVGTQPSHIPLTTPTGEHLRAPSGSEMLRNIRGGLFPF